MRRRESSALGAACPEGRGGPPRRDQQRAKQGARLPQARRAVGRAETGGRAESRWAPVPGVFDMVLRPGQWQPQSRCGVTDGRPARPGRTEVRPRLLLDGAAPLSSWAARPSLLSRTSISGYGRRVALILLACGVPDQGRVEKGWCVGGKESRGLKSQLELRWRFSALRHRRQRRSRWPWHTDLV